MRVLQERAASHKTRRDAMSRQISSDAKRLVVLNKRLAQLSARRESRFSRLEGRQKERSDLRQTYTSVNTKINNFIATVRDEIRRKPAPPVSARPTRRRAHLGRRRPKSALPS